MPTLALLINTFAGIGWEPEIRGALVALVGSTVLFGSVWLILATNVGNRLGTLIALTGFFGWMFVMGIIWWIYGIGLQGDLPSWSDAEYVAGDLASDEVATDIVRDLGAAVLVPAPELVDTYCPGLVDAMVVTMRARTVAADPNIVLDYDAPQPYCTESVAELLAVDNETIAEELTDANEALIARADDLGIDDDRILTPEELADAIATAQRDDRVRLGQLSLSALANVAPDLIADAEDDGVVDFGGWRLTSTADAGEAIATGSADIIDADGWPFDNAGQFIVTGVYEQGGKPKRSGDGMWDRAWNEIRNTVKFWHPERTSVVVVRPALEKETIPGQAPPFPEIDPDGQQYAVVLVRDLGSLRLPAAITTIGSLIAFLGCAWMLHNRDLELRRRVDQWDPAAAT